MPAAAIELSYIGRREVIDGGPIHKLQAADMLALGRLGQLDPELITKAVEYLRAESKGQPTTAGPVHDLRQGAVPPVPRPGDVAEDGSIYL